MARSRRRTGTYEAPTLTRLFFLTPVPRLCYIPICLASVVKWHYPSFPSLCRGFDSPRSLTERPVFSGLFHVCGFQRIDYPVSDASFAALKPILMERLKTGADGLCARLNVILQAGVR